MLDRQLVAIGASTHLRPTDPNNHNQQRCGSGVKRPVRGSRSGEGRGLSTSESAVYRRLVRAGLVEPDQRRRSRRQWKWWERGRPIELAAAYRHDTQPRQHRPTEIRICGTWPAARVRLTSGTDISPRGPDATADTIEVTRTG